jgi:hypothetical protein
MAESGAVALGTLVGRVDRLEVRCRRCDRYGRVRLVKLIEEHGVGVAGITTRRRALTVRLGWRLLPPALALALAGQRMLSGQLTDHRLRGWSSKRASLVRVL